MEHTVTIHETFQAPNTPEDDKKLDDIKMHFENLLEIAGDTKTEVGSIERYEDCQELVIIHTTIS